MNQLFKILTVSTIFFIVVTMMEPAFAGPGGKIALAVFQSFLGKILFFLGVIFFLPLIVYTMVREYFAQRHTLKDLRKIARFHDQFDWLTLRDRITDCFYQIHVAWSRRKIVDAEQWMTDWYCKNQQLVYLDQWAKNRLINHCRVKNISGIKPLFLACRNAERKYEGSRIVVSITAKMEDYLIRLDTGKIVEGKQGFKEVETVWTFTLQKGQWVVANIEEGSLSLEYAQLTNEIPGHVEEYDINEGKAL